MDEEKVVIGLIRRAHGLKGEVLVESLSDFPERFGALADRDVFLLPPEGREAGDDLAAVPAREVRVTQVKAHGPGFLMRLSGVDSREEAEKLGGFLLGLPRAEAVPLGEGEYYAFQLVGLEVVSTEGKPLGRLREVHRFPASDVWEIWDEATGRELLLPAVDEVVRQVDLDKGVITVTLLAGMLD